MKQFLLGGIFSLAMLTGLMAQDIHFSQFDRSPFNLNPALTGLFNGDLRFHGNYRSQWEAVPVPYTTFSAAFDTKIAGQKIKSGILGGGVLFNYDRAGDSELSTLHLAGNIAYALKVNKRNYVSIGFQALYGQRRFSDEKLTFDNQFNGDLFDPSLPTGEAFPDMSTGFFDLAAGLNWHFQLKPRTSFNAGIGLFHLAEPTVSFFNTDDVLLPRRLSIHFNGTVQIATRVDLMAGFSHQNQGPYNETVTGGNLRYHLNLNRGRETVVSIGSWSRLSDAIILFAGLDYQNVRLGLSYDINTSGFNLATHNRGGPEISLIYIITKVKPLDSDPSCPIF